MATVLSCSNQPMYFCVLTTTITSRHENALRIHDANIIWKRFPYQWTFVMGILPSPMDSPPKEPVLGNLNVSYIADWTNFWTRPCCRDLIRHGAHITDVAGKNLVSCSYYTHTMLKFKFVNSCNSLYWRHNDHDGVSNHQPHGSLHNHLFGRRSKKTSKLRVTGLCAGNSPGPVNSPHKRPVTRKMFPFDDVIMSCWECMVWRYVTATLTGNFDDWTSSRTNAKK